MKRREAILVLLGLASAVGPLAARAQSPRRIGVLHRPDGCFIPGRPCAQAFVGAMKELGYTEGRDYIYDFREWQTPEQIPDLARDLVRQNASVIVTAAPPSIMGAKSVTASVPIVFAFSAEPVAIGLVRSLARPGGNLTGLTWDHGFESTAKAMEVLKETLPDIRRVAVLWDATDSVHPIYTRYFEKAAAQKGLAFLSLAVRTAEDFEPAFARYRQEKADALIVTPSAQLTLPRRDALMALAARDRVPALGAIVTSLFPNALLHYGPNHDSAPRRLASYVDRILKGAKPGELPIEQPDKYDLIVDLKVARALGITIPQSILLRADRVIE
jgi:putative ABC transport system substrate-binding protein